MAIVNGILNLGLMGEPARLDYAIREHKRLAAKFDRLTQLLVAKGDHQG